MKELHTRIDKILEQRQTDVAQFCSQLVQAGGENPPGDVSKGAETIETFLNANRVSYQRFEPQKGHADIVATVGKGKPKIILCGHIDVVPAGDLKNWRFHPYSGKIEDGKILGRGASDMKGGIASMLMAAAILKEFEKDLGGKAVFAAVCDEEVMGPAGAIWLLDNHKLEGNVCLIAEPSAYSNTGYSIVGGERGNLWIRLTAEGKPAHGSTPALGKNAILDMMKLVNKVRAIEKTAVKTPRDATALVKNGRIEKARVAEDVGILPEQLAKTMDHYTVNLGIIRGGTKVNVVPERCESEFDIRIPAGGSPDAVEEFIRLLLPENFECEITNRTPASYTPSDEPLVKILQTHAKNALGYKPPAVFAAATSDAHTFREMLHVPAVAFGPGYADVYHGDNEYVRVEDVVNATKIYSHTIIDYLAR